VTAVAVDLAAVARARTELAALVVAHPFLTSPEAHARLAAALPALVEPSMSKSLDPNHVPRPGVSQPSQTVGVRLTPKLLDAVKAETERLRSMAPGTSFGLGDGVRSLLLRALSTDPAKAVNAAPVPAETPLAASPSMPPRRATQPPARASVRPPLPSVPPPPRVPAELVETEAARVDPRQLALIAEPPADLDGMTVRVTHVSQEELRARYVAARDEESKHTPKGQRVWTETAIAERIGASAGVVGKFMRGNNVSPESFEKLLRGFDESAETSR